MEKKLNFTAEDINKMLNIIYNRFLKPDEIVLGKYIIKYNAINDSLDFLYTGPSTIEIQYETGTFNQNGVEVDDPTNSLIRVSEKINCFDCFDYYLYFKDSCSGLVCCLYDKDGSLINMTTPTVVKANQNFKINTTEDTAFIAFRFTSVNGNLDEAISMTKRVVLYSIGVGENPVTPELPEYDYVEPIDPVDPDITPLTFEKGSINTETGENEPDDESSTSVRVVETIMVSGYKPHKIIIPNLPSGITVQALRLYFYDANGQWLGTTSINEFFSEEELEFEMPSDTAGIRFKFRTSDRNVATALSVAPEILIQRSDAYVFDMDSVTFEAGSFNVDTGEEIDDDLAVRTSDKLQVNSNQEYYILVPGGDIANLRFYHFDVNGKYIGCSQNVNVKQGGGATFKTLRNTSFITFKFNSAQIGASQEQGFDIAITMKIIEQLPE